MKKFFARIPKKPLLALVSALPLALLGLVFPFPAHALFFLGPVAVAAIVAAILYFLQNIVALLFTVAGFFVSFFLDMNYRIFEAGSSGMIAQIGWNITRDVANLGFVLFMIIAAVATIVRYKDYAAKAILPKLIAAAIIVNFSFAIAQFFVDFSHALTKEFLDAIAGPDADTAKIAQSIASGFDVQKLLSESNEPEPIDPEDEPSFITNITTGTLLMISSLAFTILFTLVAAFALLAFAFMLFLRYLHLTFLVIMAPIAWLFWVFPDLKSTYSKWWSSFLKWVFFAPVASFFIYLALLAVKNMGVAARSEAFAANFVNFGGGLRTIVTVGGQMFVLCGLLLGGLIIAQSWGVAGAAGAMKLGKSWQGKAQKWAGERAAGGARNLRDRALTFGAGKEGEGKTWAEKLAASKAGQFAAKIPLVGRGIVGLSAASARVKETRQAAIDKSAKEIKPQDEKTTLALARSLVAQGKVFQLGKRVAGADTEKYIAQAVAVAEKLLKDKEWKNLSGVQQQEFIRVARKAGAGDRLSAIDPSLAVHFAEYTDQNRKQVPTKDDKGNIVMRPETDAQIADRAVAEATRKADASKISFKDAAIDPATGGRKISNEELRVQQRVAVSLTNNQISKIGVDADADEKQNFLNTIQSVLGEDVFQKLNSLQRDIEKKQKVLTELSQANDPRAADVGKDIKDSRDAIRDIEKTFEKNADKERAWTVTKQMISNVNYQDIAWPEKESSSQSA